MRAERLHVDLVDLQSRLLNRSDGQTQPVQPSTSPSSASAVNLRTVLIATAVCAATQPHQRELRRPVLNWTSVLPLANARTVALTSLASTSQKGHLFYGSLMAWTKFWGHTTNSFVTFWLTSCHLRQVTKPMPRRHGCGSAATTCWCSCATIAGSRLKSFRSRDPTRGFFRWTRGRTTRPSNNTSRCSIERSENDRQKRDNNSDSLSSTPWTGSFAPPRTS